jgi:SAM-dependent methyltransferase
MSTQIEKTVREQYAATAASSLSNNDAGVRAVAEAFGYSTAELQSIPADANMGLSCGNPIAFASLRPGEVVVDLGCGGGLDVFLAAQKVGPMGKSIGIDMTQEMIARARKNAAAAKPAIANVEFHLATIDHLPLADASVDVIVSNCVINLAADKPAVFREICRVLKPGGRVAISDIALKQPLPPVIEQNVMAYVGCIAGAISIDAYEKGLVQAGLAHVQIVDSKADLNAYAKVEGQAACCSPASASSTGLPIAPTGCCGSSPQPASTVHEGLSDLLRRYNVNDYAASVKIFAVKPR